MKDYLRACYDILNAVYREGAFANLALKDGLKNAKDKKNITRIVYGVIERNEEFLYMIKKLCPVMPKAVIRVILKLGMYLIKYMDSLPNYAVVNSVVELTKEVGKRQLAPFVNATLKKYIEICDELPKGKVKLAIDSNMPMWLIEMYINDYGQEQAEQIIKNRIRHTHLRHNLRSTTKSQLASQLEGKTKYTPTEYGFLIGSTDKVCKLIAKGKATVQSLCSMLVCKALTPKETRGKILDACAAPGGKSVYLSELNKKAEVFACDIHLHRLELIKSYKKRMFADNVTVVKQDAQIINSGYLNFFDAVLADVPCSGLGTIGNNPDILINRKKEDIEALVSLQKRILKNVARYVKPNGVLVYATCSNLKAENEEVVEDFLSQSKEFELEPMQIGINNGGMHQFFTDEAGHEGFFVCRMKRV